MRHPAILGRFIIWKAKNIENRSFLLILSVIVGIISGLLAVTLKTTVHYIEVFFTKSNAFDIREENYYYLFYPLIGIFITVVFIRTFIKEDISHGISRILYSISKKRSIMKLHNLYSSIIACTFTGGFGGSVGMEAPIVSTGAAVGSNLGQLLRLDFKTTTLLVACGATGAMAGIFKAPIAALIFSLEVLMLDLTLTSIVPLLMASVTGSLVANLLLGDKVLFYFSLKDSFEITHLPFYIGLGIIMFLWIVRKVSFIRKRLMKFFIRRFILTLFIGVFPVLNFVPEAMILVLLVHYHEKTIVRKFFDLIEGIKKAA